MFSRGGYLLLILEDFEDRLNGGLSCFKQDIGLEISSNLNYAVILCDDNIIGGETLTS